ncbi:MAG: D-Ala-D-Ala carboxypeptidase family metallohydrolase, partial [Longimicrobiales bacterium]|nr:D-Ala-D-Ala carboxypeptidase family metallohydrolase [Longimicrobiales bacterium]
QPMESPRAEGELAPAPAPATASFALRVGGQLVPLRVMALAVLPEGEVRIRREGDAGGRIAAEASGGRLRDEAEGGWSWRAPEAPGFHDVRFVSTSPVDTIQLTFMVVRPATEIRDGRLNGYRIGSYRARPASMSASYEPPRGFVEARPEHYDLPVSPNFRLGQFLCKDPGDPRYLLVSPRLLIKLEALLAEVNAAGYSTPSLTVMSGFRTPAYNRAIGNTTDFSRHLGGDAADVYVDGDGDGYMDDLDGNGRMDVGDARWLAARVEAVMAREDGRPAPGGLSVYRRNAVRGPFVHVDTRGHRARW